MCCTCCQLPEWYWTAICSWSLPPPPPYIIHINEISATYRISPWYQSAILSADPQAYNLKSNSDSVPTIQIDLASPQSPDSASTIDEFTRASKQQQEEDQGLMMKPPAGPRGANQSGEADGSREQQKLMRCLSDPGPSADEDEDEPFLPWLSGVRPGSDRINSRTRQKIKGITSLLFSVNSKLVPKNKPELQIVYTPDRGEVIVIVQCLLDRIIMAAAVMAEQIRTHNLRYSGRTMH